MGSCNSTVSSLKPPFDFCLSRIKGKQFEVLYPQSLGENQEKDCLSDFLWGCSTTPIEPDSYMSKHGLYSAVKIILPNKIEPNGFRWQHGTRQSLVLLKISVINNK